MTVTSKQCQVCHKELFRPRICRKCGETFCNTHASPKAHRCSSLKPVGNGRRDRRLLAIPVAIAIALAVLSFLYLSRGGSIPPGPPWEGNIGFVDVTDMAGVGLSASGHGLAVEDLDGDLDLDLYVVNKDGNRFFMNNGNGSFTEVTDSTGVGRGPRGGHGVAVGDYDNDGDRDIFCANWEGGSGSPNVLYRNDGGFSFTDVTRDAGIQTDDPGNSHSTCMGDFNNNGWLDIVATNVGGTNFYFQNRRDGSFLYSSVLGTGDGPHGLVSVDYDLDGDLDLYLSNQEWQGNPAGAVFYENTGQSFRRVTTRVGLKGETHSSFFGDFDGDGDYDFFGVDRGSAGKRAYYENLGKRFKHASSEAGAFGPEDLVHGMDSADFDLDGDLDVLLTGGQETILLANRGGGRFEDITERVGLDLDFGNPKSVCFFDYDGDGDLDIYVVVAGGSNRLLESRGNTNNWVRLNLRGVESNRDGIGARLEVVSGDLKQFREVPAGRGHIHDPLEQVFGLGTRGAVDSVKVIWPSGTEQVLDDLPVNTRILITEGEGWGEVGSG
jgi:hypothetical protein